jgi:Family of unknown function (DUF6338)
MIPETLGAFLAFLGLVAPGLAFQLLRDRRRPSIEETAFREATRVALTSLVFTVAALGLLALLQNTGGLVMPDVAQWMRRGNAYLHDNLGLVSRALLLELVIALSLVAVVDWILRRSAPGRIVPGSIWFQLFRQRCPDGTTPWLHVKLEDDTEVWGYVGDYTPDQKLENRELTIIGPKLQYRRRDDTVNEPLDSWSSIAVRGAAISWMKVTYVADDSPPDVPRVVPASWPKNARFPWAVLGPGRQAKADGRGG